jgi:hypothetical protein
MLYFTVVIDYLFVILMLHNEHLTVKQILREKKKRNIVL